MDQGKIGINMSRSDCPARNTYLLICIVLHSNNLVEALDLSRLGSRGTLNTGASHEGRHGATELLCRCNCGEGGVLQLAIALLEDGEGREQTGERRRSGLSQSRGGEDLRAGSPQDGVSSERNHGGNGTVVKVCYSPNVPGSWSSLSLGDPR
jgi:hypothetical protein